jgi:hypothetical protein
MFYNLLRFIGIYFFLTVVSIGAENISFKFHKLNVKSISQNYLEKIITIRGKVEEYPYGFNYYINYKDEKVIELIETFYLDNEGDFLSRFNTWARNVLYISNSKNGCNNSEDKIYHAVIDNGPTHFTCFSVKLISKKNQLVDPNFNSVNHIPMIQRKVFLNKYFKKNPLTIPDQMIRIEHYFYKSGKLIWVFYNLDTELFFDNLSQNNIKKIVQKSIEVHQNFEKDLRYKPYMKIDF